MTYAKKEIYISCSFEGRDKSLIKSILNIDSRYGDFIFKYTENHGLRSVFITQNKQSVDEDYYAVVEKCQSTIRIKPTLNPKTIKGLFKHLSQSSLLKASDSNDFYKDYDLDVNNNVVSQFQDCQESKGSFLLKFHNFIKGNTGSVIEIKSEKFHQQRSSQYFCYVHIIVDIKNGMILSRKHLTDELLKTLINSDWKDYTVNNIDVSQFENLNHCMDINTFMWKLGIASCQSLYNEDFVNSDSLIKYVRWPDYGCLPYQDEFIQLTAMIAKNQLSYQDLLNHSNMATTIINAFLNAAALTGHLRFVKENSFHERMPRKKQNHFLSAIKSYLMRSMRLKVRD